ncbi:hypothetical protein P0136_05805 [Lentisphaerota bacterium ZTH]|nr:hypothetical protein JYG24_03080 [Lentisphaerota bacterium]WET07506.1 hypothetical protein P0136_05805 [Lentisphaerota bacterium ZTH]
MSTENFKVGSCAIVYKGIHLGGTVGGPLINIESTYHERTAAQSYSQLLAKRVHGMKVTVDAEIKAIDAGIGTILGNSGQLGASKLAHDITRDGGELKLIPYNTMDIVGYCLPNAALEIDTKYAFHETEEHTLTLRFEAFPDSEGILFKKFDVDEAERLELTRHENIDMIQFERALTSYIADKLNLEVDKEIFRGGLPFGVNGCGVAIIGKSASNIPGFQEFDIKFFCRYEERDCVLQLINKLDRLLPEYGKELIHTDGIIKTSAILKHLIGLGSEEAGNGRVNSIGEIYINVII